MSINPLKLIDALPAVLKTVGKVVGIDVDPIVNAIAGTKLSPEQQLALQQELHQYEVAMAAQDTEQMKAYISEAIAEVGSNDKFVSRARPSGYYAFILCSVAVVVAGIAGVALDHTLVLEVILPLGGAGAQWQYNRTQEKKAGVRR